MTISLFIPGDPKGQPRPRAWFNRKIGKARVFDPATADGWKSQIALALRAHVGLSLSSPLVVTLGFVFGRPKSHHTKCGGLTKSAPRDHMSKPDIDNAIKAVLDACTMLRIWRDDTQVVEMHATKRYAEGAEMPGVMLTVQEREARVAPRDEDAA